MRYGRSRATPRVVAGIAFEAALGAVALIAGLLAGSNPLSRIELSLRDAAYGTAAAVPILLLFVAALRSGWKPFRRLRTILDRGIRQFFGPLSIGTAVLLAVVAGLGEELLFRGLIQSLLAGSIGTVAAVIVASILFGLVHWVTPFYAIYAGVLGVYLGVLYAVGGNLLVPIVCHTVYDAVALRIVSRKPLRTAERPPGSAQRPLREPGS